MGLERIVNVVSIELKEVEKLNNTVLSDFHPDIQADFHIPLLLCPLRGTHWQDERENEDVCDELIKACSDPKAQESRVVSLISKLQPEALRCWGTLTGSSCEPAVEKEQDHHLPAASGTPSTQDTLCCTVRRIPDFGTWDLPTSGRNTRKYQGLEATLVIGEFRCKVWRNQTWKISFKRRVTSKTNYYMKAFSNYFLK